jgi:hypothetical protein
MPRDLPKLLGKSLGLSPAQGEADGETIRRANEFAFCALGDPLNCSSADRVDKVTVLSGTKRRSSPTP